MKAVAVVLVVCLMLLPITTSAQMGYNSQPKSDVLVSCYPAVYAAEAAFFAILSPPPVDAAMGALAAVLGLWAAIAC